MVRRGMNPVKIEIPFLAALVLIGTSLLALMAAQGVKQALFSTAIISVEMGILDGIKTCVSLTIAKFEMVHG
jgi:hypothetical protein